MANFRVKETFYVETSNYFVIAGVASGKIEKGMFFKYIDEKNELIKLPIAATTYIDKRAGGKLSVEFAICIKTDKDKYNELYKKLHLKGNIYTVRHYNQKKFITQNHRKVRSIFGERNRINIWAKNNDHFLRGRVYSVKSLSTHKAFDACYVGKRSDYCSFKCLGDRRHVTPREIPKGSIVRIQEA